jgi:hypothetical protein
MKLYAATSAIPRRAQAAQMYVTSFAATVPGVAGIVMLRFEPHPKQVATTTTIPGWQITHSAAST